MPDDELLTPQQVADMLGVSADTVRTWIRAGKLAQVPGIRRERRITAAAVEAVMPVRIVPDPARRPTRNTYRESHAGRRGENHWTRRRGGTDLTARGSV